MPLIEINGPDAVATRKSNPCATWGDRSAPNRIEPFTTPSFAVPFQMQPGEKIFTVGSCFARNVEAELVRRGFDLPMRKLFQRDEFIGIEMGAINNFGTPSIYNEFAWALGEQPFDLNDHIMEVQGGKFVDLHVISSIRPGTREAVVARRRAITEGYRSFLNCRVVIMTLGLVEIWYDSRTRYYLNSTPRPSMLRAEPDRFKLHVLSYEEAYRYLEDTIALIRKHGRPDVQVILTVSPVPLAATHRPDDVIVANSYSKSVLRVVAETIVQKHDFVTYFPSYESIMHSDRRATWKDDFIHVNEEIVALNVDRMIDAFANSEWDADAVREEIATGGVTIAIERAKRVREEAAEIGEAFFAEFGSLSARSTDFAVEQARFLINRKDFDGALRVVDQAPKEAKDQTVLIACEALLKLGRGHDAFKRLDPLLGPSARSAPHWSMMLRAAQATGDARLVLYAVGRWSHAMPKRAGRANTLAGKWFEMRGNTEKAIALLQLAVSLDTEDALARIYLAEAFLSVARLDDAKSVAADIRPRLPNEVILFERLRSKLLT